MPIKFARFGPGEDRTPQEGACFSSFVVVRRMDSILVMKVGDPELWADRWFLPLDYPERWMDLWVLPAGHLLFGEHPDATAERILKEMVGINGKPIYIETQSHIGSNGHWDLCFIYLFDTNQEVQKPAWCSDLKFQPIGKLGELEFGRGHYDILRELGDKLKSANSSGRGRS